MKKSHLVSFAVLYFSSQLFAASPIKPPEEMPPSKKTQTNTDLKKETKPQKDKEYTADTKEESKGRTSDSDKEDSSGKKDSKEGHDEAEEDKLIWNFPGSLLSSYWTTVPKGTMIFDVLSFFGANIGNFNALGKLEGGPILHTYQTYTQFGFGLTDSMDLLMTFPVIYQTQSGISAWGLGDCVIEMGFQIFTEIPGKAMPSLRLFILETFPTGRYDQLPESEVSVDGLGAGAYSTSIGFALEKVFFAKTCFPVALSANPFFTLSNCLHLQGANVYGGNDRTLGRLTPGIQWGVDFWGQIFLVPNKLSFSVDMAYANGQANVFSGNPGGLTPEENADLLSVLQGSSRYTWSAAPALSYNIGESGFIQIGFWWSFAGKNLPDFRLGAFQFFWGF